MSKILILSAGTSKDSYNSQLARHLSDHMSGNNQGNYIYENLFEGIPFLLDTNDSVPDKIANMRKSLEESSKLIIFSPVYNGGYLAHLKNTLDLLSLAYEDRKYNSLFKDKNVAVITSVRGLGGNAQAAFELLSAQLLNYSLKVFDEFHLITNKEHQNEELIEDNKEIFDDIKKFVFRFLDF